MSYTLFDATIYMAKGALVSLQNLLNEAESQHPDPQPLLTARLAPDMWPFSHQVTYACNVAQSIALRLSGQKGSDVDPKIPSDDDDNNGQALTYANLHAQVERAIAALDATDKDTVNQVGEEMMVQRHRDRQVEVPIKTSVALVNMPNIYFHVSIAYAILRKEGVALQKGHWSRGFVRDYVPSRPGTAA